MSKPNLLPGNEVLGRRCFVYRNLTKGCYSLKCVKTGLVIGHAKEVFLEDVSFKVSAAGRDRVRREQKKYVHAGIVGRVFYWVPKHEKQTAYCSDWGQWANQEPFERCKVPVVYNPYATNGFVEVEIVEVVDPWAVDGKVKRYKIPENGTVFYVADAAWLSRNIVKVENPE